MSERLGTPPLIKNSPSENKFLRRRLYVRSTGTPQLYRREMEILLSLTSGSLLYVFSARKKAEGSVKFNFLSILAKQEYLLREFSLQPVGLSSKYIKGNFVSGMECFPLIS